MKTKRFQRFKLLFIQYLFFLILVFLTQPSSGIAPMEFYNSTVAGWDDPGFRDGAFFQALFNNPCGLAIDDSGDRLFVADRDNHRIRVVYLNEDNRVATLAGSGKPGKSDGKLPEASFNYPTNVVWLPGDRLAVFDSGNLLLRLIDLKKMEVTSLAGNIPETALSNIQSLCYRAKDDCLYLAESSINKLRKWDLKSGKLETVLAGNPQIPAPQSLCVSGDKLYVADLDLPDIYQVEPSANTIDAATLTKVGTCENVHALAGMNGTVYAAQEGTHTLIRILPDNQLVGLATAWGFLAENNDKGVEPLLNFNRGRSPSGFVISPKEASKLYITCPDIMHSIISVKDYDFGKLMEGTAGGFEFNYPDVKPTETFRILVVGNSRVGSAMFPIPQEKLKEENFDIIQWDRESTKHTNIFPKQLEFFLNAQASLNGAKKHFEVFVMGDGGAWHVFKSENALEVVKQKDIDLVIALAAQSNFHEYFGIPLTKEGIPGTFDAEYLLKPISERIAPGVTRHLYELCKTKNLVKEEDDKLIWLIDWSKWESLDPEIRKNLSELTARLFKVTQNKLQAMKTSSGSPRNFLMLYIPWKNWQSVDYQRLWRDTSAQEHLNFLDLSEPYYAMKTGFYPTTQQGLTNHYLVYGNTLIAYLLSHYLIEQKWIPFETEKIKVPASK